MQKLKYIILPTIAIFSAYANSESLDEPATKTSFNTANVINSAWYLKRLSESLAPGVDTRCYIAKHAAFMAENLRDSAKVVSSYQKTESDTFAIHSVSQAMQAFDENHVEILAADCQSKSGS